MTHRFACNVLVAVTMVLAAASSDAQGQTVYEPSPNGKNAPNAGKLVRRCATDIWKQYGGSWKLAIRQAT